VQGEQQRQRCRLVDAPGSGSSSSVASGSSGGLPPLSPLLSPPRPFLGRGRKVVATRVVAERIEEG
jgi:hypothetical protein